MTAIKLIDLGTAVRFDDPLVAKRKRIGTVHNYFIFSRTILHLKY